MMKGGCWNAKRKKERERGPANAVVREATKADDIFTRFSSDILKVMFTVMNNSGRNGAPSHSEKILKKKIQ